jgi:hypothetical protein
VWFIFQPKLYNKGDAALLNFLVLPNEKNGRAMDLCKRKYGIKIKRNKNYNYSSIETNFLTTPLW